MIIRLLRRLRAALVGFRRGPAPRRHPLGNGVYCDGCDRELTYDRGMFDAWRHGRGYYCARCHDEIEGEYFP